MQIDICKRNMERKLNGGKESLRLQCKSDSQLNGEPPSKDYLVDEFSLSRNGPALVSPLFSHWLGAALEEPGLGMKELKGGYDESQSHHGRWWLYY